MDCVICSQPLQSSSVVLGDKGCQGLNRASVARGDSIQASPGQKVHKECRKTYCNPNVIKQTLRKLNHQENDSHHINVSTRSKEDVFTFTDHCLFCGQQAFTQGKKRAVDVFPVRTLDFQITILNIIKERDDDWARNVHRRLGAANDLPAVDAVYHQTCNVNFRTFKQVPKPYTPNKEKKRKHVGGRPGYADAFMRVVMYLEEDDDEQVSIMDLVDIMKQVNGGEAYDPSYMKQKLQEHFGPSIIITEINGKPNVVTFRRPAQSILHEHFTQPRNVDLQKEKLQVMKTAAELIKEDIKNMKTSKAMYPSSSDLSSSSENLDFIPETLIVLLRNIFSERYVDTKIASIGQAITQAARPRVIIAPLQIGLGLQLHHHFASKFLIDMLYNMGFCSSYSEVKRFEASAAVSQGLDIPGYQPGQFVQYIADNVDHNVRTLDGYNTFHGMGIIASVTPTINSASQVPRLHSTPEDLCALSRIDIHHYKLHNDFMSALIYEELAVVTANDPSSCLDVLSKVSWKPKSLQPSWSGMMQQIQRGSHPGTSSISFLPMIDMNPSDLSCIYSTLVFVCAQANRYETVPILTFDQPLYWKAFTIIENEQANSSLKNIVLRLGAFHTQMSFLGCIGHIMSGSGLQETLETVYAPNAVLHMLTGKAVSRAVRGHFLVDRVLNHILIERDGCDDDIDEARDLFDQLLKGDIDITEASFGPLVQNIQAKIGEIKHNLGHHRTAGLWFLYLDMIDILRSFIKAERTGNWPLHLKTNQQMLPFFAATGHNMYAKSAYIYLQSMLVLEEDHPEVHSSFMSGHHVIRRSDRYWSGLSTDLVIEQVLMKNIKSTGGMTRGSGIGESQRAQWLLSMPACVEINNAMQIFAAVDDNISDQHKDSTEARKARDDQDASTMLSFLEERNPFQGDVTLRNIATGVTADTDVNVERSREVGRQIIITMSQQKVSNFTFRKVNQVVNMSTKTTVKSSLQVTPIDQNLLFQRLVTVADRLDEELADIFKFELCSYPSSLFDSSGLMREANKPALADALWKKHETVHHQDSFDSGMKFVIDGGSLLQRIPWMRGSTYSSVLQVYVDYIQKRFEDATVVFDGYMSGPSTKDTTHLRRCKGVCGPKVHFTDDMLLTVKKELFLSNNENKQLFIDHLSSRLTANGIKVVRADEDADLSIVQTAVTCAREGPTTVIGEDTDVLVLLCFHADNESHDLYFRSESKKLGRNWHINTVKRKLGTGACQHLLLIHAITGCDTTSRLFGISKGQAYQKITASQHLGDSISAFYNMSAQDAIATAGQNIVVHLYGGNSGENLDELRCRRFAEKVAASSTSVQVCSLPPTSAAAYQHCLRVYHQVRRWMGYDELQPCDWGWNLVQDKYLPVMTKLPPAPERLINVIRCKCKVACDSRRCTCRKHGLSCSSCCAGCHGLSCENSARTNIDSLDDNEQ